ncbi:MAG: FAD:protein FMN transferase [Gammaproteobacteria bacterium]|nr:FAD:protein FMN transferase [Gammaproteobacteria bacterium]
MKPERAVKLQRKSHYWLASFTAMGSPCELLTEESDESLAQKLLHSVSYEAWRIEDKFSRYLRGNIVDRINRSHGVALTVDDETANLLDFAQTLHELSEGRFDITSGVLREAWTFDGSDNVPSRRQVKALVDRIGWDKVCWHRPRLLLRAGMQIDFGGIGKEYAVDRAATIAADISPASSLVNFGGDLVVTRPPSENGGWRIGIETPGIDARQAGRLIRLQRGALATSGDENRYLLKDGVRYGHILDPRTGWPVPSVPRSVTVAADSCTQAGMLTTLAMLKGADAEEFLAEQGVQHWVLR